MGRCVNHPEKETSYACLKHNLYMCEDCLVCRDPEIYCKYRSACPIHFLTRRKGNLDEDEKTKAASGYDIKMNLISYRPIGIIHSPFKTPEGTPIQPTGAKDVEGTVELFTEYTEGLDDLAGFSHIYLFYHFHLSKKFSLKVTPFLDNRKRGLFATRAPSRPNPIGLSVVRLVGITGGILKVRDIDVVDGTSLLDVKPYVPEFDIRKVERIGWIGQKTREIEGAVDDGRFS